MRGRLKNVDPRAFILIGVAVVLLVGYWAIINYAEDNYVSQAPDYSTFSADDYGSKVLYSYLDGLGVEVDALQSFDELPEEGTIVAAEAMGFVKQPTTAEAIRLRRWVEGGGRLVLIGAEAGAVLDYELDPMISFEGDEAQLEPIMAGVYSQAVERVSVGGERLLAADPSWVTYLKDTDGQMLITRTFGQGEIVWLACAYPATNLGIVEADNARLVTLLAAAGEQPVYFDEYHHGYVSGGGIWERLESGGRAAVVLAVLGLLVWLLGTAGRIGPPIPPLPERSARTGAYIDSLAGLYRKAGTHSAVIETYMDGLKEALAKRYGSTETGFSRHPKAEEAAQEADELRRREKIGEHEFVETVRRLARARREVEGRDE